MKNGLAAVALACLALAGCGADGGSSSGSGVPPISGTPTPTPTPVPTPTPTPTFDYQTAYDPARDFSYELFGAEIAHLKSADGTTNTFIESYLYDNDLVLGRRYARYRAEAGTFSLAAGFDTYSDFSASDLLQRDEYQLNYRRENGMERRHAYAFRAWQDRPGSGLDQVHTLAIFYTEEAVPRRGERQYRHARFITGTPTLQEDMATSGRLRHQAWAAMDVVDTALGNRMVTYRERRDSDDINDAEFSTLVFDFESGTLTGTITMQSQVLADETPTDITFDVDAKLVDGGPMLEGTVRSTDGRGGPIAGSLNGPQGRELGFAFTLRKGESHATGVLAARAVGKRY
ncbi:transferrin-binding protein-like solute binding protein [Alteriqipengyuania lutimaris]|uniref:Transferrin-binding protein B C-lobe/N-lobe beta-barrel domain-containing protein n=1 Tax=Alteriqipengyuania lutimaris TaxID=1538146 RepID=A0A395LHF5_9SPHN|nr:hypothetical protein [Alteriqipengyuania lutimaris]MBB3035510.1 hypothetical protein [Alteriqipengyuania lutimaris]RDS76069.1 hypothetical protein DL238_15555 [Alteriqipengyuania lutimaris]